jgi:hypothetical protein
MAFSVSRFHSSLDTRPFLLEHFVRAEQHRLRNCHVNLLGRLEIDHKLELSRLFYWQIGSFRSLQNLTYTEARLKLS